MNNMQLNNKTIIGLFIIFIALILPSLQNLSIYNTTTSITATSGSAEDIQVAVNAVANTGGGTVYIPSGIFDWDGTTTVNIPAGVNVIGAGQNNTILKQINPAPFELMFSVLGIGAVNKSTRISGITFRSLVTSSNDDILGAAVRIKDVIDYRVDHCHFIDFPNVAISIRGYAGCRGVIDHNIIEILYKEVYGGSWGYGVIVNCNNYWDWDDDITHFFGKYDTIPTKFPTAYIEDNTFYMTRHAVASNQLGWYVFRHNTATQGGNSVVDVHGSSSSGAGGRGAEVYDNVLIGAVGVGFRGGSGVIYNNKGGSPIWVTKDISGTPYRPINNLWIWNNDGAFTNYGGYYVEDVNYFLREPTQTQDGFTYIPYPYPHPLVSGEVYIPTTEYTHPRFRTEAKTQNEELQSAGKPHILTTFVNSLSQVEVTSVTITNDSLTIILDGAGVQELKVFCGGYGKPDNIVGAASSYDSNLQILTLEVQFSSAVTLTLSWFEEDLTEPPTEPSIQPSVETSPPISIPVPETTTIQIMLFVVGGALIYLGVKKRRKMSV